MKNKIISLENATEAYMQYLKDQCKSPRTLYTYGRDLDQILQYFGPDRDLTSILKFHVGKFLKSNELLFLPNGSPRAQQTLNKTVRVMRMFFDWVQTQGWLEDSPIPKNTTVEAIRLEAQ